MKPESSAASWLKFFSAAGIPRDEAENYAVTFSKNQIQLDMLPEIKKEYLKDMGITLMGHIIAILRHAKAVYADEIKKKELSPSQKQSLASGTKEKPMSRDGKISSRIPDEAPEARKQSMAIKRKSMVVQLKQPEEPKSKVKKKLCDSSDDVYISTNSNSKSIESPSKNINCDSISNDECKKGVFNRLGVEVLNEESAVTANGSSDNSVFARLGDKSLPQVSKEVTSSSMNNSSKRLVASKLINDTLATKSIIKTRLDGKKKRILVSPTYMDGTREERGILVSPSYMDGRREEKGLFSRLNGNSSMDKRNIKERLGKSSSRLLSGVLLPRTVKKVSFGSVYQKLIPRDEKPFSKNSHLTFGLGFQKGSIGLSTGVFSRLGNNVY